MSKRVLALAFTSAQAKRIDLAKNAIVTVNAKTYCIITTDVEFKDNKYMLSLLFGYTAMMILDLDEGRILKSPVYQKYPALHFFSNDDIILPLEESIISLRSMPRTEYVAMRQRYLDSL